MRIEILIGKDKPQIFPLNSEKVIVGSSVNCDIIVKAEGISRKHLQIVKENGQLFVIDQGSTNGSYLNEERLTPGKKIEFTTFFPIRLGHDVLISLLAADDDLASPMLMPKDKTRAGISTPDPGNFTKTTEISALKLNKVQIDKPAQKKSTSVKKVEPKKPESNMMLNVFAVVIVCLAGAYQFYFKEQWDGPIEDEAPVEQVGKIVKEDPAAKPAVPAAAEAPAVEKIPKEKLNGFLNQIKCTGEAEIYLCDFFPGAREEGFGVIQQGLTLQVLVNAQKYMEEAITYVPKPAADASEEIQNYYKNLVADTASYIYLLRTQGKLDLEKLKDMKINIVLYNKTETATEAYRVIHILPTVFNDKDSFVTQSNLGYIRSNGESALMIAKGKYTTY